MARRHPPLSPCADIVRREDHDRWLALLYAHPEDREALAALYAFNHEIAKTRESVSDPMIGEIRLEWWRETIEGLYAGTIRKHPVAEALAGVIHARDLPRDMFGQMIAARRADLYDERPKDLAALLAYADATGGGISALAMRICGGRDEIALPAARSVGRAWALAGILRAIAFQAQLGRLMLPDAALKAAGLDPAAVFRGTFPSEGRPLVAAIAGEGRAALDQARSVSGNISPRARASLLIARLAEDYLDRLEAAGHDPLKADFRRGALARQWKLLRAALTGRY